MVRRDDRKGTRFDLSVGAGERHTDGSSCRHRFEVDGTAAGHCRDVPGSNRGRTQRTRPLTSGSKSGDRRRATADQSTALRYRRMASGANTARMPITHSNARTTWPATVGAAASASGVTVLPPRP